MNIQTVKDLGVNYLVNNLELVNKNINAQGYDDIQTWISNGGIVDTSELLSVIIENKLKELTSYHYSDANRSVNVIGHNIYNRSDFRSLILEQRNRLSEKVDLGMITEQEAIFNYRYNGSGIIPIPLLQLRNLYIKLVDLAESNYITYINHKNNINNLSTIDDVNNYDYTIGYLTNQTITI